MAGDSGRNKHEYTKRVPFVRRESKSKVLEILIASLSTRLSRLGRRHLMASGLSKRYISALWNQQSVGIAFAGNTYALNRRRYTTTPTTHKQKTYSSARTTSKTTTSKSASTPSVLTKSSATSRVAPAPKGAMKREDSSASSKAISPVSAPVHQMKTAPSVPDKNRTRFNRTTGGMAYKVPEKGESKTMTEEEQIETVEKVMAMAKLFPTADPWGQAVETLGGSSLVFAHISSPVRSTVNGSGRRDTFIHFCCISQF